MWVEFEERIDHQFAWVEVAFGSIVILVLSHSYRHNWWFMVDGRAQQYHRVSYGICEIAIADRGRYLGTQ